VHQHQVILILAEVVEAKVADQALEAVELVVVAV
jgi:hypothetical protein